MVGMKALKKAREISGLSQRALAQHAHIAYKSLQLIEGGQSDPRLSTLQHIASALGYPPHAIAEKVRTLFDAPPESIAMISERIAKIQGSSWKLWLFNFVDAFRYHKTNHSINDPPHPDSPPEIKALLAATVETLCHELGVAIPWWCDAIPMLTKPWFVSDVENLKSMALVESPIHFRKRNIFVK